MTAEAAATLAQSETRLAPHCAPVVRPRQRPRMQRFGRTAGLFTLDLHEQPVPEDLLSDGVCPCHVPLVAALDPVPGPGLSLINIREAVDDCVRSFPLRSRCLTELQS